jgi:hypothetical protein
MVDGTARGTTSTTSRTITLAAPGTHSWYVKSDQDIQTDPISFTLTP